MVKNFYQILRRFSQSSPKTSFKFPYVFPEIFFDISTRFSLNFTPEFDRVYLKFLQIKKNHNRIRCYIEEERAKGLKEPKTTKYQSTPLNFFSLLWEQGGPPLSRAIIEHKKYYFSSDMKIREVPLNLV